jgi:hypothetical protein
MNTVLLKGRIRDQNDEPMKCAKVVIELSRTEIDNGYVVPSKYRLATDEDGLFQVALWPNDRGSNESTYKVSVFHFKTGALVLQTTATIPSTASEVFLSDVALIPPFPGKSEFEVALETVQAEVVVAVEAAEKAEEIAEALLYGYATPVGFVKTLGYDSDDKLITVNLTDGVISITKTLAYDSDDKLITVTLSGDVPQDAASVKTLAYDSDDKLISVTYSA